MDIVSTCPLLVASVVWQPRADAWVCKERRDRRGDEAWQGGSAARVRRGVREEARRGAGAFRGERPCDALGCGGAMDARRGARGDEGAEGGGDPDRASVARANRNAGLAREVRRAVTATRAG